MGTVIARKVITTDASLRGWGATHEGRTVSGVWSSQMRLCHINYLELRAVYLALHHFLPLIKGQHVLVRTDNTTVVAYINKQGGLRSHQLHALSHSLILWADSHLLSLRATHVPGIMNRGADLLSRGIPRYKDWMLHNEVVSQIWERFGRAEVDLFASQENAQCHLFFSLMDQSAPLGLDALAHEWPHVLLYAFPPLELITATLSRVREKRHSLLLVAPHWPTMHWMAEIFQLLCNRPWAMPLRRDLVSQAGGEIFHAHPERLALWVWPLREEHQQLHALCPVRALRVYVDKTASFRGTEQLFVSWSPPHRDKPLTKQRLSHWIVEAISVAYESSGLHPPAGLRAHSTRGMATSWAMFRGTSVEEICAAASWATPHTFARFYRLDVTGPSLSQNVLSVGSSPRMPM
ncbi:hypothetical protein WMY93_004377 [Mugilogobius chulae]|uniref:Reverse transcriptase RNase H-like domain-containing protein n=1 Tax=Mugilogobius chulae TaxID=88201 RepID=A0AAW0PRW1_9GOBI